MADELQGRKVAILVWDRTLASFPTLDDLYPQCRRRVGERGSCANQGLVTSRAPDDVPAFCSKIVE